MFNAINEFLKPHFKIGVEFQDIYKGTIAISRIIERNKVIIIVFLPKISRNLDPQDISEGWNGPMNQMLEKFSDVDFEKLQKVLAEMDLADVKKLKQFLSEFQVEDITKLKNILNQFDNEGTYAKLNHVTAPEVKEVLESYPKLGKVLENFNSEGELKTDFKFKNPVLAILSKVTPENIQEILQQVTATVGLNSPEFEAIQFTSIPAVNVIITIGVLALYQKNLLPGIFRRVSTSNEDVEMGPVQIQKMKEELEQLKSDIRELNHSWC